MRTYVIDLVLCDVVASSAAAACAYAFRFGLDRATLAVSATTVPYELVLPAFVLLWLLMLGVSGAYRVVELGYGTDEYRRVISAGARTIAGTAIIALVFHLDLARGLVAATIPLTCVFTLIGRRWARRWLRNQRKAGRAMRRVVLLGPPSATEPLTAHLRRSYAAGFEVVATCGTDDLGSLVADLRGHDADVLAVTGESGISASEVRRLTRMLEGTGIDLVVAPAVSEVAGPRIVVRPAAGLPLLHIEEPKLGGGQRLVKSGIDRLLGTLLLVVTAPLVLLLAAIVRATSPGPAFFRQTRVGKNGTRFDMLKLRTMVDTAEADRLELEREHGTTGPLFKLQRDPRVTRVGRVLRRWSFDELPQLVHVVRGQMSLVGPRPPLPSEVAQYSDGAERRLLVTPGITGLWQVSGRADLSWEETVRLDLYYVENWSLALDAAIMLKTVGAVVFQRGAY